MEKAMHPKVKLNEYEESIENEILNFVSLSEEEKSKILMMVYKRYKDFVSNAKR